GEGVPGMSPGLLYVNDTPSAWASVLNPPNCEARSVDPLSLELSVCAFAVPLAPRAAMSATANSAHNVRRRARRLRRRTDRLLHLCGHPSRVLFGHNTRFARLATAEALEQHARQSVGLTAEGDDGEGDTGEHQAGLVGILTLHERQQSEQRAADQR